MNTGAIAMATSILLLSLLFSCYCVRSCRRSGEPAQRLSGITTAVSGLNLGMFGLGAIEAYRFFGIQTQFGGILVAIPSLVALIALIGLCSAFRQSLIGIDDDVQGEMRLWLTIRAAAFVTAGSGLAYFMVVDGWKML